MQQTKTCYTTLTRLLTHLLHTWAATEHATTATELCLSLYRSQAHTQTSVCYGLQLLQCETIAKNSTFFLFHSLTYGLLMVHKFVYKPSVKDIMDKNYEMFRWKNQSEVKKKDLFNSPNIPHHSDLDSDTDGCHQRN